VQRLQVELLRRLRGNEFHRRALYRLGDRFAVAEVILMSFQIWGLRRIEWAILGLDA
jgi:hypothetical protein